ncbi:MAG: hypothetical protein WC780_06705 [Lentimicrobiaceae bacterium]|jgi:hypothetical protein
MKVIALALLFSLALFSCQKIETSVDGGNPDLEGSWVNPQYSDTLLTYTRADKLIENEFGITFKTDNKLIYRQNSGWCGTPPIVTADYEGIWTWSDSIVNITVGYWGGTADFTWKVLSLTHEKLVISVLKSEYHDGK